MKLREITEPREGFVYETNIGNYIYTTGAFIPVDMKNFHNPIENEKIIGKLGLTHKIEDGKLVELPRKDIEVGDVFENMHSLKSFVFEDYEDIFYILKQARIGLDGNKIEWVFDESEKGEDILDFMQEDFELGKKIGILNVTHELILDFNRTRGGIE